MVLWKMWYFEIVKSIQVLSDLQKPLKGCSFNSCCLFTLKRNNQGTRWHIRSTIDQRNIKYSQNCKKTKSERRMQHFILRNSKWRRTVSCSVVRKDNHLTFSHDEAGDIDNDCCKCNKVYKDGERIVALSCMYPVF